VYCRLLSKLSIGEGSLPSKVPVERFQCSGWIVSGWATRYAATANKSKFNNYWGHQLSRNLRQKVQQKSKLSYSKDSPSPAAPGGPFSAGEHIRGQFPARYSNMDKYNYILKPIIFTAVVSLR
jgi:hypothetical protein